MANTVDPETYIDELIPQLIRALVKALRQNDRWKQLAAAMKNEAGSPVFSEAEISEWTERPHRDGPAHWLLEALYNYNTTVKILQTFLIECEMFDALNILITNELFSFEDPVEDKPKSVRLGEAVILKVVCAGSPYPTFQWYFEGQQLHGETAHKLEFKNFRKEQRGHYTCRARQRLNDRVMEATSPRINVCLEELPPRIDRDLADVQVKAHQRLELSFTVISYPEPSVYRWYKNGQQEPVQETETATLTVEQVQVDHAGQYHCEVISSSGHCLTRRANVQVEEVLEAKHKWALLVANEQYQHMKELTTPILDMHRLAAKLQQVGFRCQTTWSNVSWEVFWKAVIWFTSFIQEGDYVVFYFAGHGIIDGSTNYMAPVEAKNELITVRTGNNVTESIEALPSRCCVSFTKVFNVIQEKSPALLVSIIDMCRPQQVNALSDGKKQHTKAVGNAFTIYSTSRNYATYEDPKRGSILMQYLADLITQPDSVAMQGFKLLQKFKLPENTSTQRKPQIPAIESDLKELRSLADPVALPPPGGDPVMKNWEKMADLGKKESGMAYLGNIQLNYVVYLDSKPLPCHKDMKKCSQQQCDHNNSNWLISNCVYLVVKVKLHKKRKAVQLNMSIAVPGVLQQEEENKTVGETFQTFYRELPGIQSLQKFPEVDLSFTIRKHNFKVRVWLYRPGLCLAPAFASHSNFLDMEN